MIKTMIYAFAIVTGITVIAIIGLIFYLQFTEYTPAPIEMVSASGKALPLANDKTDFSFLSWNLGYAGLGCEMDFFYDGGKRVRPEKARMDGYLNGICSTLASFDTLDFIFVQEIDRKSKRTYHLDQQKKLDSLLSKYCSVFALNYKVAYIPLPAREPIGEVESGLSTFSKYLPESNERHAYEAFFYCPKKLMFLKRCFLSSSFTVLGGKQLIVVNLHNSAYDESGELRRKELTQLQEFLQREYQKGSFIIVGGDWNSNPKGFRKEELKAEDRGFSLTNPLGKDFMPGWQAVYDHTLPTNRNVNAPYQKGVTGTTLIDFFLISPNVSVLNCFTVDEGFKNSDHNPVFAKFRLQTGFAGNPMIN